MNPIGGRLSKVCGGGSNEHGTMPAPIENGFNKKITPNISAGYFFRPNRALTIEGF